MALIDFIPTFLRNIIYRPSDGFYRTSSYFLGQKEAVYIDTQRPYTLYNSIPELKQVIDKKSTMFSNMDIKLIDSNTREVIEDAEFYSFIRNPNVLQNMNKFLRNFKTQEQVYGNQFIYKNKPSKLTKYPASLMNISPKYLKPYKTGKVFEQVELSAIISHYEYDDMSVKRVYNSDDIMYTKIDDLDDPVIGTSPLISLQLPLTNTKLAYDYRNIIMGEKGAIGILSNKSRDAVGNIPIKKEDKEKILNQYTSEYGIGGGQKRILLTDNELSWQPMTYPTKDLLLFEEVDANKLTIIDHFGLNVNIFSSKNATFENVRSALIQCYQDTIIPEADEFCQSLTSFLKIENGLELYASFEHIPILQDNYLKEQSIKDAKIKNTLDLLNGGIIDRNQAIFMLDGILGA